MTEMNMDNETSVVTLTVTEAARGLQVRVDEIYRLVRSGKIKAKKVNGKLAIDFDSLVKHNRDRDNRGRKDGG